MRSLPLQCMLAFVLIAGDQTDAVQIALPHESSAMAIPLEIRQWSRDKDDSVAARAIMDRAFPVVLVDSPALYRSKMVCVCLIILTHTLLDVASGLPPTGPSPISPDHCRPSLPSRKRATHVFGCGRRLSRWRSRSTTASTRRLGSPS